MLACLVAIVLVGCADGDPPSRPDPQTTPEPAPEDEADDEPVPSEASAGEEPLRADEVVEDPIGTVSSATRQSPEFPRWGGPATRLADARVLSLPGLDRLVLEFDGAMPSWQVRRVSPPIREEPGGAEVDLRGSEYVEVRLAPASSVERGGDDPTAGLTSPTHLEGRPSALVEALLTGDASGLLTWSLGLAQGTDVAVGTLDDPPRLVIDVVDEEE